MYINSYILQRYHKNCYTGFISERNLKAAQNQYDNTSTDKIPFNYILRSIRNEQDKVWNSSELLEEYRNKGGTETNSTCFVARIKEYMKDEIHCFSSPGIATVIMLKKKASKLLKLVSNEDEAESLDTAKIAKQIKSEIMNAVGIKDNYPVLDETAIQQAILPTLNEILINISPKFETNEKTVALISSILTSTVCSKVSMVQVALGLFVREKKMIEFLNEYGVTSSYDEVRRFKISAAYQTEKSAS